MPTQPGSTQSRAASPRRRKALMSEKQWRRFKPSSKRDLNFGRSNIPECGYVSERGEVCQEDIFSESEASIQAPDLASTAPLFLPREKGALPVEVLDLVRCQKSV